MKAIGVVGSPRRGMNTGLLVEKVLEGARSQGVETELFYLDDYRIESCQACEACKKTGQCAQEDGMWIFYDRLGKSRGVVLGTPIYFDFVSSQTKLFLDRLYPYVGPALEHRFPSGVKAVLALTWGAENPAAYDGVVDWLKGRLSFYFDIETVEVLTAANTSAMPVGQREELQRQAFAAGVKLAGCLAEPRSG